MADENRFAVPRDEEWTGNIRRSPTRSSAEGSLVTTWPKTLSGASHKTFVVETARTPDARLCGSRPRGVRDDLRCRAGQRLSRLLDHQTRHLLDERSGGAALRRVVQKTRAAERTRAQADLGINIPALVNSPTSACRACLDQPRSVPACFSLLLLMLSLLSYLSLVYLPLRVLSF